MGYWLILSERKGTTEEIRLYETINFFFPSLIAEWVNLFWLVFMKKMGSESYFPLQIASCWSIKTIFFIQFSLVLISNLQFCLRTFIVPGPVQRKLGGKEYRKFMYEQCILAASLICQVKLLWIVLSCAEISATITSNFREAGHHEPHLKLQALQQTLVHVPPSNQALNPQLSPVL